MAFVPATPLMARAWASPRLATRRPTVRPHLAVLPRACSEPSTPSPPPASSSADSPVPILKTSYDLAPPPNTFYQAVTQAQSAVDAAIEQGFSLLEIEFPPLPTSQLESASVGAYDVSDANLRLAVDFAEKYASGGRKVVLAFPDRVERMRAEDLVAKRQNLRLSCLRDSSEASLFERLWVRNPKVSLATEDDDDMFIVLGASCQELPDVEELASAAADRPVIFFNLKLDSARGDLGLPAFPRKQLHYRFLSRVLPVYYLRTRTYSRSMARPPYIVNYSGCLYRVFPGDYQVLLDTSAGSYRRLKTYAERPPLGEVRDVLTEGLNLEQDGEQTFLYRGYKSRTWWEEDRTLAESNEWRS